MMIMMWADVSTGVLGEGKKVGRRQLVPEGRHHDHLLMSWQSRDWRLTDTMPAVTTSIGAVKVGLEDSKLKPLTRIYIMALSSSCTTTEHKRLRRSSPSSNTIVQRDPSTRSFESISRNKSPTRSLSTILQQDLPERSLNTIVQHDHPTPHS